MKYIGLDPSLAGFGYSVITHTINEEGQEVNQPLDHGVWKTPSSMLYVKRYMTLAAHMDRLVADHPDAVIGMEIPPPQASWFGGLYALHVKLMEIALVHRRFTVLWSPSTVKSVSQGFLGYKGTLSKHEMVKTAAKIFGNYEGKKTYNHNAADALIVAYTTARFNAYRLNLLPASSLSIYETHSFIKNARGVKGHITKEDEYFFSFNTEKWAHILDDIDVLPSPRGSTHPILPKFETPVKKTRKKKA